MSRIRKYLSDTSKLRVFNDLLTLLVIGAAGYVVLAPFLPQATYWVREESPIKSAVSKQAGVRSQAHQRPDDSINRVFIPKLGLGEKIHEGGAEVFKYGVVRRGRTSTPPAGSNTVLVGHRFTYDGQGIFYHLDKLSKGDDIVVQWGGRSYEYLVTEIYVVQPEQIEVEAATDDDILTIYTCTPLWSAKDRLVVRARLVEKEGRL